VGTWDGLFYSVAGEEFHAVLNHERIWPIYGTSLTSLSDGSVVMSSRAGLLWVSSQDGGKTWKSSSAEDHFGTVTRRKPSSECWEAKTTLYI
jgi:hypothetical protein